jgi:acyl-CoA reductase-like NAD-dependent aldehyde dehydrogenase
MNPQVAETIPEVARKVAVDNPATGAVVAHVPVFTPAQVAGAVARARQAQPEWAALGFDARAQVFDRSRQWVLDNRERVVETICSETGKTYEDALIAELAYIVHAFKFWARKAPSYLADQRIRSASPFALGRKLVVRYEPIGVVGVIGPWNYPLSNSFGDCLPALMAGNAVVLKPSDLTPLTGLLMVEMFRECGMPVAVYQVTSGDGETGAALIDEVDYVMFTGSTATGKKVIGKVNGLRQGVPAGEYRDRGDHDAQTVGHHREPRQGCRRAGGAGDGRGTPPGRRWQSFLRADDPRRRRSHDGVHARGDVRADAPDHEGR